MYGMLLESVQHFVQKEFGEEVWALVLEAAGIRNVVFATHQIYPDAYMTGLATACARVVAQTAPTITLTPTATCPAQACTPRTSDDFMRFFGRCFVRFFSHYGYDRIVRCVGRNFRDFLHGVDNLHHQMRFSYPRMMSPSMYVEVEDASGAVLHYRSRRCGFTDYVVGQLEQIAALFFGLTLRVRVVCFEQEGAHGADVHVTFRLDFDNSPFIQSQLMRSKLTSRAAMPETASAALLLGLFPFCLVFDDALLVRYLGHQLANVIGNEAIGRKLGEYFRLRRPRVHITWQNIMLLQRVVFELEAFVRRPLNKRLDTNSASAAGGKPKTRIASDPGPEASATSRLTLKSVVKSLTAQSIAGEVLKSYSTTSHHTNPPRTTSSTSTSTSTQVNKPGVSHPHPLISHAPSCTSPPYPLPVPPTCFFVSSDQKHSSRRDGQPSASPFDTSSGDGSSSSSTCSTPSPSHRPLPTRRHLRPTKMTKSILLKGQMRYMSEWKAVVFLCTPLINDLEEMQELGLYLNDLSLHDLSREMVLVGWQHTGRLVHAYEKQEERSQQLEQSLRLLDEWKTRGDDLLYSMIPRSVANRLRSGSVDPVSTCETFETVSVLFGDLVGFSEMCSVISPMEAVGCINNVFTTFDEIIDHYHVYKVETVGTVYMLVGGAPQRRQDHLKEVGRSALSIVDAMKKLDDLSNGQRLSVRVGIHVGPVVAGVVGMKTLRYCFFGDTVNTASRMQSNSMSGRILISEDCHNQLRKIGFITTFRDIINVKGKGTMNTYWLLGYSIKLDKSLPTTPEDGLAPVV